MTNNVKSLIKRNLIEYAYLIGTIFLTSLVTFIVSASIGGTINILNVHFEQNNNFFDLASTMFLGFAIVAHFIFGIVFSAILPQYIRNGLTRKEYMLTFFIVTLIGAFLLVTTSLLLSLFGSNQVFTLGIYLYCILASISSLLLGFVIGINFLRFHWIFGVLFIGILGILVSISGTIAVIFQLIELIEQRVYEFEMYIAPNPIRDPIIAASIGIVSAIYILFITKKISIKAK